MHINAPDDYAAGSFVMEKMEKLWKIENFQGWKNIDIF